MLETASHNPLTVGLSRTLLPEPCTVVIFGGAGDLSRRKLIPAIYNLMLDGVLPANFAIVGFARTDLDDTSFRALARKGIESYSRRPLEERAWADFEKNLFFVRGPFDQAESYTALSKKLDEIEPGCGVPGNRIFYLSIPPSSMGTCVEQLQHAGLVKPHDKGPFSRIIVEKPIGHDLASAKELNATIASGFDEEQVFRIDHYLGKETVQNLMVAPLRQRHLRAALEPEVRRSRADHGGRGRGRRYAARATTKRPARCATWCRTTSSSFSALTAMEPPWALTADVVRDHKLEVLQCLRPVAGKDVDRFVVRAQYGAGFHHGVDVPGYRREQGVRAESTTETYVAHQVLRRQLALVGGALLSSARASACRAGPARSRCSSRTYRPSCSTPIRGIPSRPTCWR